MKTYEEVKNSIMDLYRTYSTSYYWFDFDFTITPNAVNNTLNLIKFIFSKLNMYPFEIYPEVNDGYFLVYDLSHNKNFYVRITNSQVNLCYNIRNNLVDNAQKEVIADYNIDAYLEVNIGNFLKQHII